ncbi:transmembrane channel-like protein 5 isoform X4 [Dermochelys coriacea]|uniref:transmembrane channel-like protein 5 isoform X4 n=1 Tax=Dermochelys coriacea TaxID=27794 RepID=UPI0018E85ACC|nr:transmembrane channel-like protein 5 isoform X4 [Dermochelys coriacea]XP_038273957.1 transmembrane channel-like protein 5 isoform X4 [Dermochelys coriacea]XP_043349987.1 transmembrane channel-like protein 5 isoform X4 [Dermochelys coriacea]
MFYHDNEAFENPDYHYSETLEIDRSRERNSSFHQNLHDSSLDDDSLYNSYEGHSGRGQRNQDYPMAIPMASMQPGFRYSHSTSRSAMPNTNPYGNPHTNPSFEYEPELAYAPPSTFHAVDGPYVRRSSDMSDGGSFSQRYNRRQADLVYRMPSSLLRLDTNAETYNEDKHKQEEKLIKNLASMSSRERIKAIQKTPKTMKEKRDIRNKVLMEKTKKSVNYSTQSNCCTQCLYKTALSYRRFKNGLSEYLHLLQLWQKTLKVIGGKFGTSVLSYFVFLKWLLTFNIFSFLVNFSFITIPQLIVSGPNNLSFNGLELLTGAGYFKKTVLYYGFYTNSTIMKTENNSSYNMQLAYIFTIGIYFIICFFSLVYSMAKSFRKNFINPQTYSGSAAKLLCIWDFNITNEKAVKLKQSNLSTQIKESLSEVTHEVLNLSLKQRIARIAVHLVVWVASLGIAAACCAGVYFLSRNNLQFLEGNKSELENEAAMLALPIVVSLVNLLIPFCFALFGLLEKFQYPRHQLYATVIRNIFLKISIIGILCYYWLSDVATSEKECWESLVGQDIYRLIVIDFIFCLFGSFFGEFVRRIIGTKCCKKLGVPEFDIARNVLDLIYTQTLAWIGIFFAPLMPAMQIISFFIIFYVKKVSLMRNCQPPRKVWRASQMTTLFIFLLFFPSFSGVLVVMAVTIWRRTPSKQCGPFQGLTSIIDAVSGWIHILDSYSGSKWVVWIYHNLIGSVHFFFILTVIVLMITYLYWQIIEGRKIMVRLLHEQIINEGKDKVFLLNKLRALQTSKLGPPKGEQQERSSSSYQPSRQAALQMTASLERPFERNGRDFYAESFSAGIPEKIGLSPDSERHRPAISETLALALRARQQAEWEMQDDDDEDFRP